jgi:hypothetical protein
MLSGCILAPLGGRAAPSTVAARTIVAVAEALAGDAADLGERGVDLFLQHGSNAAGFSPDAASPGRSGIDVPACISHLDERR